MGDCSAPQVVIQTLLGISYLKRDELLKYNPVTIGCSCGSNRSGICRAP